MKLSRRQSLKALATAAASQSVPKPAFAAMAAIRLIVLEVGGTIIQDHKYVPDALQSAFAVPRMTVTLTRSREARRSETRGGAPLLVDERPTAEGAGKDTLVAANICGFQHAGNRGI